MRDLTQHQFERACRRRGFVREATFNGQPYRRLRAGDYMTECDFPTRRAALAAFIRAAEKQEKRT